MLYIGGVSRLLEFLQRSDSQSVGPKVRNTANIVLALYIALFMSGALNFLNAGPFDGAIFAFGFYTLYAVAACLAFVAFSRGFLPYKTLVVSEIVAVIALVPVFLSDSPLDALTKNYLVSVVSLCIFPCVARLGDRRAIITFAASLTCVLSVICLFDACFLDGFTNTTGRAAGTLVNPNVSALALLVFATGSVSGVPFRLRPAFLLLVAGAIIVTFSRSSLLIALCTLLAAIPVFARERHRTYFARKTVIPAVAVCGILILFIVLAFANNKAFRVAASESFGGVRTAMAMWQDLQKKAEENRESQPSAVVVPQDNSETPASSGTTSVTTSRTAESGMTPQLIAEAEHENSAVARGVIAQRALDEYASGPVTGRGLSYAFGLVPHNSILLFAVAFGLLGWLIVPAFLLGLLIVLPWERSLPLVVLLLGGSLFSHDLYLSVPLVAGIVVLLVSVSDSAERAPGGKPFLDRLPFVFAATVTLVGASMIFVAELPGKPIAFEFKKDLIRSVAGKAYFAVVPPANPKGLTRIEGIATGGSASETGLRASEDDRVLGPASNSMDDVVSRGGGRYGYENMWFFFSSTDGSDPTQNNKSYRLATFQRPHPLFYLLLAVLFGWCVTLVCWSRRPSSLLEKIH